VADQFLHTHGRQDQKNIEHCRSACSYRLAAQGIRIIRLPDQYQGMMWGLMPAFDFQ
jgi:hypothetical protein